MGLIDTLASFSERFMAGVHAATRPIEKGMGESPHITSWLTGADTLQTAKLTRPYSQHPTVYRAIRIIATSIAQLDLEVWPIGKRSAGEEPIADHWLPALIQAPNKETHGDTLIEATLTSLESTGEAWWWKQDVRKGAARAPLKPNGIVLLHPHSVWPTQERDENDIPRAWSYLSTKGAKEIPREDLVVFRYYNPWDPLRGLGPLTAAMVEATGDHTAAVWNRALLQNNAIPPLVFEIDAKEEWPEEDRRAFMEHWNSIRQGPTRAGLAAAMPPGVKANLLKVLHQEMEWLGGRRYSREQLLSVFGVPPGIAGVREGGNLANRLEEMKFLWHVTLMQKIRYLKSVIDAELLQPAEPNNGVFFAVERVLADIQSDEFAKKVETGSKLFLMGFRPTDINETLGLGLPTKDAPWLEEGYLPFSVTLARTLLEAENDAGEQEPPPPPPPPPDSDADDDDPDVDDDDIEDEDKSRAATTQRLLQALQRSPRDERWTGLAARYGDIGRSYTRQIRGWLWGLRRTVLKKLEELGPKGAHTYAVVRSLADDILWDDQQQTVKLVQLSQGAWQRAIERGAAAVRDEAGILAEFNFLDPAVTQFLAEKSVKITAVSKRVRETVRGSVLAGIEEGESTREIAGRIRDTFKVERGRSLTIARTEVAQAFTGGRFEQMKQGGITHHGWLSSRDGNVRDSHMNIDGWVVAVGDTFPNDLRYPAEPSGNPAETINCRCVTTPEQAPKA